MKCEQIPVLHSLVVLYCDSNQLTFDCSEFMNFVSHPVRPYSARMALGSTMLGTQVAK